jgi:hypothetical protein
MLMSVAEKYIVSLRADPNYRKAINCRWSMSHPFINTIICQIWEKGCHFLPITEPYYNMGLIKPYTAYLHARFHPAIINSRIDPRLKADHPLSKNPKCGLLSPYFTAPAPNRPFILSMIAPSFSLAFALPASSGNSISPERRSKV